MRVFASLLTFAFEHLENIFRQGVLDFRVAREGLGYLGSGILIGPCHNRYRVFSSVRAEDQSFPVAAGSLPGSTLPATPLGAMRPTP